MKSAHAIPCWLAAAGLLLAGCETVPKPAEPAPAVEAAAPAAAAAPGTATDEWAEERREVLDLLAYFQRAGGLAADELRRDYAAANQAFGRERSEPSRLRLAVLLALPGTAFHDDSRLAGLLDGAVSRSAPAESPRRQLVTLLARHATERARLAALAQRAEGQLKDEQKRSAELHKKLDALLKIDREMRNRRRAIP